MLITQEFIVKYSLILYGINVNWGICKHRLTKYLLHYLASQEFSFKDYLWPV